VAVASTSAKGATRAEPLPRRRRSRHLRSRRRLAWLFMAPLVAINLVVILGPSIAAIYYSFTDWTGIGTYTWVGFENYTTLFSDAEFRSGITHNLYWTAIFLTVPVIMGLGGAFLLSRITRFQILFRVVFFIPYVLASVVNAAVWETILEPDRGLLPALGIGGISFLGDPGLALPSVAFVDNWHFWGFLLVIFLAAMQSVDKELYEAVRMDGAGPWREFKDVTLPGIRPTLIFVLVIVTIWSFLAFDYVYILTQGGPAGATETAATLLYKTVFQYNQAGYAAAMGISLAAVAFFLLGVYGLARRRGWNV